MITKLGAGYFGTIGDQYKPQLDKIKPQLEQAKQGIINSKPVKAVQNTVKNVQNMVNSRASTNLVNTAVSSAKANVQPLTGLDTLRKIIPTAPAAESAAKAATKSTGILSRMGRYGKIGVGLLAGAGVAYGGYKGYKKHQLQKVGEAIYKHKQLKKIAINGAVGAEYLSRMGALD